MPTWHPWSRLPPSGKIFLRPQSPSPPLGPTLNSINLHGIVQLGGQSPTLWGKAIFCSCRVCPMVPMVATAFSVDTVVTARHSVTFLSPFCPSLLPLHRSTAAIRTSSAKRGHSNLETTCFFLLQFTITFSLPPKIL